MNGAVVVYAELAPSSLRGRDGVDRSKAAARECLRLAAERAGAPAGLGARSVDRPDGIGAPDEADGWFASLTHTAGLVAAGVSRSPLGVDAEWRGRERITAATGSVSDDERALLEGDSDDALLRLWTAKEAVLKRIGAGLTALSRCRLARPTETGFAFDCDGEEHRTETHAIDTELGGHWLSIATHGAVTLERTGSLTEVAS